MPRRALFSKIKAYKWRFVLRYKNEILQMYCAPISHWEIDWGLPRPLQPNLPFDFDTVVGHPVRWPDQPWVDLVNAAKEEFEVDNAIAVFCLCRVKSRGGDIHSPTFYTPITMANFAMEMSGKYRKIIQRFHFASFSNLFSGPFIMSWLIIDQNIWGNPVYPAL